ncbi:hypothetical protein AYO21_05576 [Fonsecaea monophora]|uniref:Rhodopsin domain-containing protein n=1 Tax=Fonsecaea monophora TaxID=254056 RepID=A0A177F790_9EURO|nr:hypothetical protein AYO21_05576 [Fonsecaea monophora]KAH0839156.1 putative integral membrane protein [Fonsecaea pedrosoi]OAG40098.1 hypothetical protein AYO21_05576 [Fonsecaea monophora]
MAVIEFLERRIYHEDPPDYQSRIETNPTLIVSWWCTLFSLTAILIRVLGRWVRTERLFREDWIMFYSIIPLMIRMGLVHVVLIWGTNNTKTEGLTSLQIHHREIGSRLVLAARIFYAAYIWIAKLTVLEFLKRLIGRSWAKSYEVGLRFIYGFLVVTFIAVVIGTLTECQPFSHYWQVVPDPGSHCREGLVQLIVMGVCDIVSDVVLIVFPIPLVWQSSMRLRKKISLVLLFLLSTILIAITAYRVPSTISRRSSQQYRSLLASLEILAAAGVSNAIVIGSFIRDRGVKKAKFRAASIDDTSSLGRQPTRTRTVSTTHHHWGSDEDLARGVGVALPAILRHGTYMEQTPRLAEAAAVALPPKSADVKIETDDQDRDTPFASRWNFAEASRTRKKPSLDTLSSTSTADIRLRDLKVRLERPPESQGGDEYVETDTPSRMGFFDVGGLVDHPPSESPISRSRQASVQEVSRRLSQPHQHGVRSGSKAFLSDIGGLLARPLRIREEDELHSASTGSPRRMSSPARSPMRFEKRKSSHRNRLPSQQEDEEPIRPARPSGPDDLSISDAGGLLR